MFSPETLAVIGSLIVLASSILQLIAAIGMIRFPEFYVRLHVATVSAMGGSLMAVGIGSVFFMIGSEGLTLEVIVNTLRCLLIAAILFMTASTGSHVLARASYISGRILPVMITVDELKDRVKRG